LRDQRAHGLIREGRVRRRRGTRGHRYIKQPRHSGLLPLNRCAARGRTCTRVLGQCESRECSPRYAKIAATRIPRIETALPSRYHKAARLQTAAFPSKIFIRVAIPGTAIFGTLMLAIERNYRISWMILIRLFDNNCNNAIIAIGRTMAKLRRLNSRERKHRVSGKSLAIANCQRISEITLLRMYNRLLEHSRKDFLYRKRYIYIYIYI